MPRTFQKQQGDNVAGAGEHERKQKLKRCVGFFFFFLSFQAVEQLPLRNSI